MKFIKVDDNGNFIGDVTLKSPPEVWVDVVDSETGEEMQILAPDPHYLTETPKGFYQPKWDFELKKWTEGKPQEEIDAIVNTLKPKTSDERLQDVEGMLLTSMDATAVLYEQDMTETVNTKKDIEGAVQSSMDAMNGIAEIYELLLTKGLL